VQNSTLVLTADTRSRDPKEPDGSAATLWGKINPKSFGDRVQYAKPAGEGEGKRCAGAGSLLQPAPPAGACTLGTRRSRRVAASFGRVSINPRH
jgi:hypothetical protein